MDYISLELQKTREECKILHERYYNTNKHSPDFNWQEYRNEGYKLGIIENYKNVLESVCNDNSTSSTNRNKSCLNDSFPLIFNMLRYLENRLNSIELKEIDENKEKENFELKLEKKNYEILLLQKDKEIETLKIELEELRKFYINS